jgi:hypothetical protein
MSTRRSPIPHKKYSVSVPQSIVSGAKTLLKTLLDEECPLASIFIWLNVYLVIYYLFFLPDFTLHVKEDNQTVVAKKTTKELRGWLVLAVVLSTIAGTWIIKRGCVRAGPWWAIIWFLVALLIRIMITELILASVEHVSLPGGWELLKQVDKSMARNSK